MAAPVIPAEVWLRTCQAVNVARIGGPGPSTARIWSDWQIFGCPGRNFAQGRGSAAGRSLFSAERGVAPPAPPEFRTKRGLSRMPGPAPEPKSR